MSIYGGASIPAIGLLSSLNFPLSQLVVIIRAPSLKFPYARRRDQHSAIFGISIKKFGAHSMPLGH